MLIGGKHQGGDIMDFFSSRELAIGFWLLIGLMYVTYSESLRPHLKQLLSCFCNIYILTPILGMGFYVAILSYSLIELDIWNTKMLPCGSFV